MPYEQHEHQGQSKLSCFPSEHRILQTNRKIKTTQTIHVHHTEDKQQLKHSIEFFKKLFDKNKRSGYQKAETK
jgi:hypothetical protein